MNLSLPLGRPQMNYGLLGLLLALAAIAGAWGFQLIGGYIPCALCLEQRVPYYWGLPIGTIGFGVGVVWQRAVLTRLAFLIFAACMAWSMGLAIYHAGAEWMFWAGPSDCGGAQVETQDAGALLAQIESVQLVSCTEAGARFLGLSFAGWNAVVTFMAMALGLLGAFAKAKQPLD